MKEAFKKIEALAEELYRTEQKRNGGCFIIIASPERDADECINLVGGTPKDLIEHVISMMNNDPKVAAVFKTAVVMHDVYIKKQIEEALLPVKEEKVSEQKILS